MQSGIEVEDSYFIDDVFFGEKSVEMADLWRARTVAALRMINAERIRAKSTLKVLDVGCGDGTFSKAILESGNEVCGVELNRARASEASRKKISVMVTDLKRGLPFADESFDLVHAAEVLEHVYDTEFFLKEARRVLVQNGVLIVTVPNLACLPNRIRMIIGLYPKYVAPARRHWGVGEHMRAFTKDVTNDLLARNGFRVEETRASVISILPTRRTRKPWSKLLARTFPGLGEVLIFKSRKRGS